MGGEAESGSEPEPTTTPGPTSIGKGRSGPIRSKLRRALKEARDAERMTLEDEVRALVAERCAAAADAAADRGDEKAMLVALDKLLGVMDALPIRKPRKSGGGGDDSSGDDERGTLLRIMDGPPTVGDAAHA